MGDANSALAAGRAALEQSRFADAAAAFQSALNSGGSKPDALAGLSAAAWGQGRVAEAHKHALAAYELAPRAIGTLMALAPPAIRQQDTASVQACFAYLTQAPPATGEHLITFWAARLADQHCFAEAAVVYRALIDAATPTYKRSIQYAEYLIKAFRPETALPVLEHALRLSDNPSGAHALMAQCAIQLGDLARARQAALNAIARDKGCIPAYASLAEVDPKAIEPRMYADLEAAGARTDLPGGDRGRALLALAHALESAGDYDAAFARFREGNAHVREGLEKAGRGYDAARMEQMLAALKEVYSPAFFARAHPASGRGEGLIFIVGMPRSGTTLTDQIVASHSRAASVGENTAIQRIAQRFLAALKPGEDAAAALDREAGALAELYYKSLPAHTDFIVDKLVTNFWNAGFIRRLFPAAKIILMRREPMDVCLSIFRLSFLDTLSFACDLDQIAHFHSIFARTVSHWDATIPDWALTVQYETLVEDFEPQVRRILDHCGLPFEEACLKFQENKRPVFTLSAAQVRKGVFTSSRERWRKYEKHLAPLKAALGRD
ncbi:MAG: sulfotransferase [Hyphomonadaceae bacterium]